MNVIKRDGRKVAFDKSKIVDAILKAYKAVDGGGEPLPILSVKSICDAKAIAEQIANIDKDISVEEIQDIIEKKLMASGRKDVAKAYVIYRNDRNRARQRKSDLMRRIRIKLNAEQVENQNANVDERSFGGRFGAVASEVLKQYALDELMSDMARNNHLNNEIYIHDLDHYALGDHNCFQRDTKFITSEGVKAFTDFSDGEKVVIKDHTGEWREATVRFYGRQPMSRIELERCGKKKTVKCTRNHRWLLSDGSITEEIKVGDRLMQLSDNGSDYSITTRRDAEMFCLGFVIGDGCDHTVHGIKRIQAALCANKSQFQEYFEIANYHPQRAGDVDYIVMSKRADIGKQDFLSGRMWQLLSLNDKRALFKGYLSADGSTTTDTKVVWTSDERVLQMITDIAPLAGHYVHSVREIKGNTNYKEDRLLYEVVFTTKYSRNSAWKVVSIADQPNEDYEAWCVDVPETHSFILDDGVITGNCLSIPFDDLLATGFNTRQTDVRPAQSVSTALQLVAVLFQLQSLQQFGKRLCRIKTL